MGLDASFTMESPMSLLDVLLSAATCAKKVADNIKKRRIGFILVLF